MYEDADTHIEQSVQKHDGEIIIEKHFPLNEKISQTLLLWKNKRTCKHNITIQEYHWFRFYDKV